MNDPYEASRLVGSSRALNDRFTEIMALGASDFGTLFDRPNVGRSGNRVTLGAPARHEFSRGTDAAIAVLNLATSGYLGLGRDPRVQHAAREAIDRYGTHTGGCRLLSGTTPLHFQLEERLSEFVGARSVVTYSSGYATNISVIAALFGPRDLVILDRSAHRSLYDGATLSRAAIKRFRHNDLDHLERILHKTAGVERRLIAVDAVYSMDADVVPLPELTALAKRHRAFLLVDEAHALGVLGHHGRGLCEYFDVDPDAIDIRIGTLSKTMAAAGGFAAVHPSVSVILRYASTGRVFSAAMTPPDVAAALAAVEIVQCEPRHVARLRANVAHFRAALHVRGLASLGTDAAIVPIPIGDSRSTLDAAKRLLARGVFVNPVIAPGVPAGAERLRCLVSALHATTDLDIAADAIKDVFAEIGLRARLPDSATPPPPRDDAAVPVDSYF
jgi:8-amino-7-oxononanoate synthase